MEPRPFADVWEYLLLWLESSFRSKEGNVSLCNDADNSYCCRLELILKFAVMKGEAELSAPCPALASSKGYQRTGGPCDEQSRSLPSSIKFR